MQNQKAFIQIALLVIAIVIAGTGAVLYKQGKLASISADISEVFKKTEEIEKNQIQLQPVEEKSVEGSVIKKEETESRLETEAKERFNLKKPEEKTETTTPLEEIDPCVGVHCAACQYCVGGDCLVRLDGYNDCGSGCQRCLNGSCKDYDASCLDYQYCNFDACVNNCEGKDISCGSVKPCDNCNKRDGCIGSNYYDYYCSGNSCVYRLSHNDPQCVSCTPHTSYSCYGSGVYWYDSCGEREGVKELCSSFQYCLDGKCYNNCQGTDGSCGLSSCVNCNNSDGWVTSLTSMPLPYCDGNKSCTDQKQEYRDYFCSSVSCSYSVTETKINKSCNECDSSKYCSAGFCLDKPAAKQCEWIWQGTISGSTVAPGPAINCTTATNGSTGYVIGVAPKTYDGNKYYLSTSIESSPGSIIHRFLCRCQ